MGLLVCVSIKLVNFLKKITSHITIYSYSLYMQSMRIRDRCEVIKNNQFYINPYTIVMVRGVGPLADSVRRDKVDIQRFDVAHRKSSVPPIKPN